VELGLVWLEAGRFEAEPACRQAGMVPAKGGRARPKTERRRAAGRDERACARRTKPRSIQ